MRKHFRALSLVGAVAAVSLSGPAADAAADDDGPPVSKSLLTLSLLGKSLPIGLPLTPLALPLLNNVLDPTVPDPPPVEEEPQFSGRAVGLYAEVRAGDLLQVKTATVGAEYAGRPISAHHVVQVDSDFWPSPFLIQGVTADTRQYTSSYDGARQVSAESRIAHLDVNDGLFAEAIDSYVQVYRTSPDSEYVVKWNVDFGDLKIGDSPIDVQDVAPNTVYEVPGLGTVVLNEQKITQVAGDRYAALVHAVHITLSVGQPGLPAGTDIYLGTAEAILYD